MAIITLEMTDLHNPTHQITLCVCNPLKASARKWCYVKLRLAMPSRLKFFDDCIHICWECTSTLTAFTTVVAAHLHPRLHPRLHNLHGALIFTISQYNILKAFIVQYRSAFSPSAILDGKHKRARSLRNLPPSSVMAVNYFAVQMASGQNWCQRRNINQ